MRHCLVVAGDPAHRKQFATAAAEVGWPTQQAATAAEGHAMASRVAADLAIVDLDTSDQREGPALTTLVQELSNQSVPLVMVCGNPHRPDEEIWARQLGVWVYVPGLGQAVQQDEMDLAALCRQAAQIVNRRRSESGRETR